METKKKLSISALSLLPQPSDGAPNSNSTGGAVNKTINSN